MPRCIGCREGSMKSADSSLPATQADIVIPFRQAKGRRRQELAFLPAALEIVETPPSPIGRAIGTTIIVLFGAALAWASLGTVDIVASAPGKVVSGRGPQVVPPLD